jgi:hypothetical protein
MKYGFVYQWENKISQKKYIGSHYGNINDNYIGSGVYFKRAYKKDINNFKRTILYVGINYIKIEDELLKLYDVANNKNYYNLKNDAIGGWAHIYNNPDEIKKRNIKISESKKGIFYKHLEYDKSGVNNPMFNKKHSDETKNKISKSRLGKCNFSKKIIEKTENIIFNSVTECAKHYNITQPTMSTLIRDKIITMGKCKNKIFSYA